MGELTSAWSLPKLATAVFFFNYLLLNYYLLTIEWVVSLVETAVCLRRTWRTQLRYFSNPTAAFH